MAPRLAPATLAFDAAGTPYSPRYGDIYHGAEQIPGTAGGQARHVFLGGNELPARWQGADLFTIFECGFGFGLNFLATWRAWRDDPRHCARLHYVAVEKHPFERGDLQKLHARYQGLDPLATQLQSSWPVLTPGMHRLEFEAGQVTLTLAFADIADAVCEFRLAADAFYLDGFAPERNADMWTPRLLKGLARLARPGATVATYTTARPVREALSAAGFLVERRPGFGGKRHMLAGRFAPRGTRRHAPPARTPWPERRALVIGAGIAGAAAAERLATRGWAIELIERNPSPATETSALHAGIFHPQLSRDDNQLARLTRTGFLYALQRWQALEKTGRALHTRRCGVLRVALDADEDLQLAATLGELGYPAAYAAYLDRGAAGKIANGNLPGGGWWFPEGGWIKPASLVAAQLAAIARLNAHYGVAVQALANENGQWNALDRNGKLIASAPVAILANAHGAATLADFAQPLASLRGQLTLLPAGTLSALRVVLTGDGYLTPEIDGVAIAGATVDFEDGDTEPREASHVRNLAALARLLPGSTVNLDPAKLDGSVGFRCAAPDRLPLIGAVPDIAAAASRSALLTGAHAADLPRLTGLYAACAYASRGLVWAALGGEIIAAQVTGEPPPLEASLLDAIDPGRFAMKRLRRGDL